MKTVNKAEYIIKKRIVDNLEEMIEQRYIEISDEEYSRINNGIDTYSNLIQEIYDHLQNITFTEQQKSELLQKIELLEADIEALKQVAYDEVSVDNGVLDLSEVN